MGMSPSLVVSTLSTILTVLIYNGDVPKRRAGLSLRVLLVVNFQNLL